jgi:hypothetical protein
MVPWGWVFLVVAVPLMALVGFVVYRFVKVRWQNRKLADERFARIAPLYDALESGRGINEEDVAPFANDLADQIGDHRIVVAA